MKSEAILSDDKGTQLTVLGKCAHTAGRQDSYLPSVLLAGSIIPFATAVVAVPMWKLCGQYLVWSIPALAQYSPECFREPLT